VTVKVRYDDFTTITRSDTRLPSTHDADELAGRAVALLDRTEAGARPVRLLGVSMHGLGDRRQHPQPRHAGRGETLPFDGGEGSGPAST
jgi:DNA polymerase-4